MSQNLRKTYVWGEIQDPVAGETGFCAIEFQGDDATRQVQKWGSRWYCSDQVKEVEPGIPSLNEYPLSSMTYDGSYRMIDADEFESLWLEGHAAQ